MWCLRRNWIGLLWVMSSICLITSIDRNTFALFIPLANKSMQIGTFDARMSLNLHEIGSEMCRESVKRTKTYDF